METQTPTDGRLILSGPRTRRRHALPENMIADTPFIRVTPNGQQISLNRDALAALGRPTHILWYVHGSGPTQRVRIIAANPSITGAFVVSYSRKLSAISTVPKQVRNALQSRRYWAVDWVKNPAESPKWVEFSTVKQEGQLGMASNVTSTPTGTPVPVV
jgi:hypothetical protein